MSQFNLRYVPTLSCNELILNGYRFNTQGANINGNLTNPLTTEIIINDDTKNQKLYEDILGLQGEIVGNINPNLVVVNQRLTALEGNVAILQGNVVTIENDIVVIDGNINTLEGDVISLQNQIDLLGNIEQGLVGNTQYLIAPYNGLAGNTSFFYRGLQVYNTPGLAINENTGTGIFSYLDNAGPVGQIQHRVQANREFQIKNGTTRINPSTNGNVFIQTTDNTPFNFVVGNSSSTYEQQYQTNFKVNSTVQMGFSDAFGGTTGLNVKNIQTSVGPSTIDTLTTELSGGDVNVYSFVGGKLNVYSQDGGGLNIESNVATLNGGVVSLVGGSQAILTSTGPLGQTDVFGSSTNITSSENTNIFTNNGKRIDINCDVGGLNSEINIGTLQTLAQTGFQKITIGSQPTIPLTTAQTSTFIEGDLYRPFPISFNFPYDQMLYIGLPTPFSGPTRGPVKSTVNPFVRSINAFAPDFTNNSFIQSSGTFTVTVGVGAIVMNCGAGGFALNVVAGPLALTSLIGGVACTTGAGAIALTSGTGTIQISTGAAPIQQETVFGDILLKAGYAASATPETALGSIYLKARNYTYITPDQAVVVGANVEAPFNEVLIDTIDYPFFGNLLTPPGLNGNSVFSNVFLTPNVKNSLVNPLTANLFYSGNVIGQTGSAQAFILYANNEVVTFSTVATVPYKGNLEGNVIQGNIEPTRFTFDFTTELPINANLYVRIAPTTLLDPNLELSRYGYGTWQSNTSIQSNIGIFLNGFVEPPVPTYDRYLTVLDDASFLNDVECNSNILVKKDAFPLRNTTITNDSVFTTGNVTCDTLNYTTLNPPIVFPNISPNIPVLQKGGLITNNGLINVAFPNPAAASVNTTSTLVDWTIIVPGASEIFTFTSTPSSFVQINKSIRIRYNSTDFLDGIVTNVAGNNVTLLITAVNSVVYSRTNVLYNPPATNLTYVSSTGPFPNKLGDFIPANTFIWFLQLNFQLNNSFTTTLVGAEILNPFTPTVLAQTVESSFPPFSVGIFVPTLGFTTGKSILYNGDFRIQYFFTGSPSPLFATDIIESYFIGQVQGFTLPYSTGSVELLSPLVLSSNINTSTSLEWLYPVGGNEISITNTNTDANFFPVFVSGSGNQILRADVTTGPFSVNPSTGNLSLVDTLKINQNQVAIGKLAGNSGQLANAVAIGLNAGLNGQKAGSIAIGSGAGQETQGASSIAVGVTAGAVSQGASSISFGVNAGNSGQGGSSIAIGVNAGRSNQGGNAFAAGTGAGEFTQKPNSVCIGINAGNNNNGASSVAIGESAGQTNQGAEAVAIGDTAGNSGQGIDAVAIGNSAGQTTQGLRAIAIGKGTGNNLQGVDSISIGTNAGQIGQSSNAIAIGNLAGNTSQGQNSIAIGNSAGRTSQAANSIIINSSGVDLNAVTTGLFINPIRNVIQSNVIGYDFGTKELTYFPAPNIPVITKGELITNNGTANVAFPAAPSVAGITTSNVYDWTGPTFVGTTKTYTLSNTANFNVGDVIRITYSLTDFVEGTIQGIIGLDISLLISTYGTSVANVPYGQILTEQPPINVYTNTTTLFSTSNLSGACIVGGVQLNVFQEAFVAGNGINAVFNTASSGNLAPVSIGVSATNFSPATYSQVVFVPAGQGIFVNGPSAYTVTYSLTTPSGGFSYRTTVVASNNTYWGSIHGYYLSYSFGTVTNLTSPIPPYILQANVSTSTGLEWAISQSTLNPYIGVGINNLSFDPVLDRVYQSQQNANFFEDFWINIFGASTTEYGKELVFNETGAGVTSRFNGVIKPAAIVGSYGRRGFIQINSGGAIGNSSFFKMPNEIAVSTIKKVTWGILCSANENLATNAVAAGNIHQAVGIASATSANNVQTSDTIIWRLFSNSGTLPGWQFVINNTIQYSLAMLPIGQTDSWVRCGFEILSMNLATNVFTVRGFWTNIGTGVTELTPVITCGVGAAGNLANFNPNLQTSNEVGLYAMSGTNNLTNKYLGIDYVYLESQNLFKFI